MKKTKSSFLAKIISLPKKSQQKKEPRNYSALVESFKTKVLIK